MSKKFFRFRLFNLHSFNFFINFFNFKRNRLGKVNFIRAKKMMLKNVRDNYTFPVKQKILKFELQNVRTLETSVSKVLFQYDCTNRKTFIHNVHTHSYTFIHKFKHSHIFCCSVLAKIVFWHSMLILWELRQSKLMF